MAGEATKTIDPKILWGGGRSPYSISYGKMMMWFFLISDALTFSGLLTSLGYYKFKFSDTWPLSEDVFHAFPFADHTHLPLLYVALMTFILIVSSVTMVLAVEAGHRMNQKGVVKWLALTVVGGFFFLFSQVWEWSHYIHGSEHGAIRFDNKVYVDDYEIPATSTGYWVADENHHIDKLTLRVWEDRTENKFRDFSGAELTQVLENGREIRGASLKENEYGHQLYADFFFFVTGFHGFHVFSGVIINLIILIGVMKGTYHKRGHYEMVEKTGLYWHFVDLVWVFVFTFYYLL